MLWVFQRRSRRGGEEDTLVLVHWIFGDFFLYTNTFYTLAKVGNVAWHSCNIFSWFLFIVILSCVATECSGNLEVNLYTLPSSVSINDWRLETESHPTPTPTPSHIGRFSEIESRAWTFFRDMQPCEDDYEWRQLSVHRRELSLADGRGG